MKSLRSRVLDSGRIPVAALLAAIALLLVPAGATAAEPVLEFVVPGGSFPVAFTTEGGAVTGEMAGFGSVMSCSASHGEGEVTGPRAAVAKYVFTGCVTEHGANTKCHSEGANEEEIRTGEIPAELVYIDQAKHEVAILLNPDTLSEAITYMTFECGGETAVARGPFLAAVGPVNQETTSFTTTLSQQLGVQTPDEWENLRGERFKATPEGSRNGKPFVTTGVEGTITVDPAEPGMIRAISAEEVQTKEAEATKQHEAEEAQKKHDQEVKQQEEAADKRRQEEAAKKHEEEVAAAAAAAKKRQEEEAAAAAKKKRQEATAKRKRLLAKAIKQCKRKPPKQRAKCRAKAEKRYGAKRKR